MDVTILKKGVCFHKQVRGLGGASCFSAEKYSLWELAQKEKLVTMKLGQTTRLPN